MKLTAQTVMALMMPSVFLAQCFFQQPLRLCIVPTLAEAGVMCASPHLDNQINFVSKSAWWAKTLPVHFIAAQLHHMLPL